MPYKHMYAYKHIYLYAIYTYNKTNWCVKCFACILFY